MPLESFRFTSPDLAQDGNDTAVTPPDSISTSPALPDEGPSTLQREESHETVHRPASTLDGKTTSGVLVKSEGLDEGSPPSLPPRPGNLQFLRPRSSLQRQSRPNLQASATTALSLTDIHTQINYNGFRENYAARAESSSSPKSVRAYGSIRKLDWQNGSENDDSISVISYAPISDVGGEVESLLGDIAGTSQRSTAWKLLSSQVDRSDQLDSISIGETIENFDLEFEEIGGLDPEGSNADELLSRWKSKQKHFLILSSAGKPIYTRHGEDNLISGYMGLIQTIISFYEGAEDRLKGFTAGGARFVIMAQGPLYLVAISKLPENDAQLRVQLEALYMQILSTLTLPTLVHLFSNRPSTDLRRPLQGTEPLLSALADTFTRGSPPTLLSALECLKLRMSYRQVIDDTLLAKRCDSLLYGLVVADGRLVSVVRPRRHSLHPSDLQLIFNMLFEADGVKAGGGENWIPLCLPGFNKSGYLYMYVSFLDSHDEDGEQTPTGHGEPRRHGEVAVILISANKESFYDLRKMRDGVVEEFQTNNSITHIKSAVRRGRPTATDIVPGSVICHFLYKSRANVQFVMPSFDPHFTTILSRRRLLSLYHILHASVHAKNAHLKVHHCVSHGAASLAWVSPLFELYCVSGATTSRNALVQNANKVLQWAQREEERLFIIGGAVF